MVYLVRHAVATARDNWRKADELRPLTGKGKRQARTIADRLHELPIKRVLSSPTVRCRVTVEPLAEALGLEVEDSDDLLEGAPLDNLLALLSSVATDNVVLCTHGDVVRDLIPHLVGTGMEVVGQQRWPKGSIWALEPEGTHFVRGHYLPPEH
jgi:broad specificity phosphatase PhoE